MMKVDEGRKNPFKNFFSKKIKKGYASSKCGRACNETPFVFFALNKKKEKIY